jgi:hypothetical protein
MTAADALLLIGALVLFLGLGFAVGFGLARVLGIDLDDLADRLP